MNSITPMGQLNMFQSFIFGLLLITATIVPGLEAAAFLSTFGLYGHWLDLTSLRNINFDFIIPTLIGIIVGGFLLSKLFSHLFKKDYTMTFAVLFGFFLSIIPNILYTTEGYFILLENNITTYIGIALLFVGISISLLFGRIQKHL